MIKEEDNGVVPATPGNGKLGEPVSKFYIIKSFKVTDIATSEQELIEKTNYDRDVTLTWVEEGEIRTLKENLEIYDSQDSMTPEERRMMQWTESILRAIEEFEEAGQ